MTRSACVLLGAMLVAVAVAGCVGGGAPPQSGGGNPTGQTTGSGAAEQVREPAAVLEAECTKCHDLGRVDAVSDRSEAEWESTIRRMVTNGASLSEAEITALAAYLAARK